MCKFKKISVLIHLNLETVIHCYHPSTSLQCAVMLDWLLWLICNHSILKLISVWYWDCIFHSMKQEVLLWSSARYWFFMSNHIASRSLWHLHGHCWNFGELIHSVLISVFGSVANFILPYSNFSQSEILFFEKKVCRFVNVGDHTFLPF